MFSFRFLRASSLLAGVALAALVCPPCLAADAGKPGSSASASASAVASAKAPAATPHGDEPQDDSSPPDGHGHANGGAGGAPPGVFQPPPDTAEPDPSLPAGTLRIHVKDPDGKPLPGTAVTIGIINNSVAKGESRRRVECLTDADGVCTLRDQDRGQLLAYRATVVKDGATFAVPPFQLPSDKGVQCVLHVYPVVHELGDLLVVSQAILYVEMKDDRVQVQEAITLYNFGKVAWVPRDFALGLPPEFTALTSQQQMSDVVIDSAPAPKKGARVRGTFAPGRHELEFRWQIPYNGTRDVSLLAGMPPNLAQARIMAPASSQMKLVVDGFPVAQSRTDNQGQRVLVTERELRRDETPLGRVTVEIRDLPTVGPARWIASSLALGTVAGAIAVAFAARRRPTRRRSARGEDPAMTTTLLAELAELERAHRAGDVGPKTYARTRRELLERLARALRDGGVAAPGDGPRQAPGVPA
ncbi:MAG: Ig-like domain-containing protein [Myxococcales bacterium]|jgi:hypothetical protein|nr:Ig-like domain-containing protein [Myxococcales bacterium]MBL0195698.1 Ig-like domain-containing protein [Myxococcales bacterium]HQY61239.1 carboxypeptidase-like regulatory domain-containing protein [Polyangiaceae bacterium]